MRQLAALDSTRDAKASVPAPPLPRARTAPQGGGGGGGLKVPSRAQTPVVPKLTAARSWKHAALAGVLPGWAQLDGAPKPRAAAASFAPLLPFL